ncbi:hypothetical protein [Shigella phage ESh22]|jgi:hypothetical protein|nr:hypothetical protein [Shigella flexneri]URY12679.1 hypothetical protein [Shigella phage ESh21]URY12860.1 hypothetical protein [Shigella phage ESh22]
MQLETAELEKGIVRTLVDVIGHRLARDKNNRPNVIRAYPSDNSNDKGLKPDQPFITVYCQDATTPYGWVLDKFVEDDVVCYRIAFQIPVLITVNGKGAHSIMLELKQRLEMSTTRDLLAQETGASVLDTGAIPNDYTYLNTDFENSAPLVVTLVKNSVLKDEHGSIIEHVIVDGELVYEEGQEPPEYTIHLDVDSKGVK